MADVLSKKRRLDKQLSLDGDAEAREEASKDGVTLLHARNRGLATNLYVYKRKISTLNVALERASRSRVQLEEVVSVFNRRLGHLESDITNLLTQLAAQQKRDSAASHAFSVPEDPALSSAALAPPAATANGGLHELVGAVLAAGEAAAHASSQLELLESGDTTTGASAPAPSKAGVPSLAPQAPAAGPVDAAARSRCAFIAKATATLLQAVLSVHEGRPRSAAACTHDGHGEMDGALTEGSPAASGGGSARAAAMDVEDSDAAAAASAGAGGGASHERPTGDSGADAIEAEDEGEGGVDSAPSGSMRPPRKGACAADLAILQRERRAVAEALRLRDALALHRQALSEARSEAARLEEEARTSRRTLERLRYDHPGLDVDEHAASIAPHGGHFEPGGGHGVGIGGGLLLSRQASAAASVAATPALAERSASGFGFGSSVSLSRAMSADAGAGEGDAAAASPHLNPLLLAPGAASSSAAAATGAGGGDAATSSRAWFSGVAAGPFAPSSSAAGGSAGEGANGFAEGPASPQVAWQLPQALRVDETSNAGGVPAHWPLGSPAASSSAAAAAGHAARGGASATPAAGAGISLACLAPGTPCLDPEALAAAQAAAAAATAAAGRLRVELASAAEELSQVREERDAMRELAEDRLRELQEARAALSALHRETDALRVRAGIPPSATAAAAAAAAAASASAGAGGGPSAAPAPSPSPLDLAVLASPAFLAKAAEARALSERVAAAEAGLAEAARQLEAASARAAAAEARAGELLHCGGTGDAALREALAEQAAATQGAVAAAVAERDAALARASEAAAAAEAGEGYRAQFEQAARQYRALQAEYGRVRVGWIEAVRAGMRPPSAAAAAAGAGGASAAAEAIAAAAAAGDVASLRSQAEELAAEKEALTAAVETVSQHYDAASSEVAGLLEALRGRDGDAGRLAAQLQRAVSERQQLTSARAALERQVADLTAAVDAGAAAGAAQARVVEAFREQATRAEDRAAAAQREAASDRARAEAAAAGAPASELRAAVEELSRQVAAAGEQMGAAQGRADAAEEARARAREEAEALRRRVGKRDKEVERLRERLAAAEAAAAAAKEAAAAAQAAIPTSTPAPPLPTPSAGLGLSRSASAFHEGAGGGGGAPEDREMARLKEQQLRMLRQMLVCSVCEANYKDAVITKCWHLFCRDCLEKRLRLRDRKCPACAQTFSDGDVKSVYFAS